jgi:hypothetical protein
VRHTPSKDARLSKFASRVSPIPNATILLSYLGDERILTPFRPGEEPKWLEVAVALICENPHITIADVVKEINSRCPVIEFKSRR